MRRYRKLGLLGGLVFAVVVMVGGFLFEGLAGKIFVLFWEPGSVFSRFVVFDVLGIENPNSASFVVVVPGLLTHLLFYGLVGYLLGVLFARLRRS